MSPVQSQETAKKLTPKRIRPVTKSIFTDNRYNIYKHKHIEFGVVPEYQNFSETWPVFYKFSPESVDLSSYCPSEISSEYLSFIFSGKIVRDKPYVKKFADDMPNPLLRYSRAVRYISGSVQFSRLDLQQPTVAERHAIIELFVNTCERWKLQEDQQLILLGYSPNDSTGRRILDGHLNQLPRDVEDRAGYAVGISLGLCTLFRDNDDAELDWLQLSRQKFGGKSAMEFILEGDYKNLYVISEMVKRERGIY